MLRVCTRLPIRLGGDRGALGRPSIRGHQWLRTIITAPHRYVDVLPRRTASLASLRALSSTSPAPKDDTFTALASQANGHQRGTTVYGIASLDDKHPDDPATVAGTASHQAVSSTPSSQGSTAGSFRIRTTHQHVLHLWASSPSSSPSSSSSSPSPSSSLPSGQDAGRSPVRILQALTDRSADFLSDLFLPREFRKSVTSDYVPYTKWCFVGSIASAATGVLSMQSLLYAIGLGAGAIPTAAAVNWVLKDGLGQFGGVLFASVINNRYDADPKRWRVASAVSLDVAVLMEILTPLCPAYFLPMASLANMAKNISWLSASATRAGFHNSFALRENLADVTAKAGSQGIASSIVGTGVGIAVSQLTGAATGPVLGAFVLLSAVHQFSVYRAIASVSLRTLNTQRLHLVVAHFLDSDGGVSSGSNSRRLPHQEEVAELEKFIPTLWSGYRSLYTRSIVNGNASLQELSGGSPQELLRLKHAFGGDRYLLNVNRQHDGMYRVDLALEEQAVSEDALFAHLHVIMVQRQLETTMDAVQDQASLWQVCKDCYSASQQLRPEFIKLLERSEWHTDTLLVEEVATRYKWHAAEQ